VQLALGCEQGYLGLNIVLTALGSLAVGFFVPAIGMIAAAMFSAVSLATLAEIALIRRLESRSQRSYWELARRSTKPISFFLYPMGAPDEPWIFYDRQPGKTLNGSRM
jgi:hypothetical protein